MRPDSGYVPVESRHPLRGLNVSDPPTQMDPAFSPSLLNMLIRDGEAFKRAGYFEFVSQALNGIVLAIIDFQKLDDTRDLVVITTTRQYLYNTGTNVWDDITAMEGVYSIAEADDSDDWFKVYGDVTGLFIVGSEFIVTESTDNDATYVVDAVVYDSTTGLTRLEVSGALSSDTADGLITGPRYVVTTVDEPGNWVEVTGDITGLISVGSTRIVIEESTGNDGVYTVSAKSFGGGVTRLTLTEDFSDTTNDGVVKIITESTTIAGDYIDWVIGTDTNHHRLYVTNGRDRIIVFDGTMSRFQTWHPKFKDFTTCRTIEVYFGLLVLGNVTTTSAEPKSIAWSDTASFDDFISGDSGTLLIPAIQGLIQRFEILGDRLIIYADDTIASLTYVGGAVLIAAEIILQNVRLVSARGVVSFGSAHMYVSQENIYFFDGTRSIRGVGDTIRKQLKQDLSLNNRHRLFAFNDVAKRIIFIVVPISATDSVHYSLDYDIFDLRAFKWTKGEFSDTPECMGWFSRRSGGLGWDDPPDIFWDQDNGRWYDESETADYPVRAMGSGSRVYLMDDTVLIDDDAPEFLAFYETRDFVVPQGIDISELGRWGEIQADLSGSKISVYYSTSEGDAWTLVVEDQPLDPGGFREYRFPVDASARTLRVRFESDKFFALRWIRVWVRSGGPR